MNRYILIRRLRWPAILLLLGVVALLHEMGAVEHFMSLFIPLLLILIGGMLLAERAVLSAEGAVQPQFGNPYATDVAGPGVAIPGVTPYPQPTGTAIVPAPAHDIEPHSGNGGQS